MYQPLKMFGVREWGTHRGEGHVCPACALGRLELRPPLASGQSPHLRCSSCLRIYPPGWFRHHYSATPPSEISGQEIGSGPLFATIQHWTRPPDGEEQLHLADFYLDIDREDFAEATNAASLFISLFKFHKIAYKMGFSGKKGFWFQVPWQVVGAQPLPNLHERVYRRMALALQDLTEELIDTRLYSQARMFRVPLTRHADSGLYKVGLDPAQPLGPARRYAASPYNHYEGPPLDLSVNPWLHALYLQAMLATALSDEPDPLPLLPTQLQAHVPCVARALEEGPPSPGTRNKLNMNLAAYYNGLDSEELIDWAKTVPGASKTPASERVSEMRSTIRWAQRVHATFSCHSMQSLGLCDPRCGFYPLSHALPEVQLDESAVVALPTWQAG